MSDRGPESLLGVSMSLVRRSRSGGAPMPCLEGVGPRLAYGGRCPSLVCGYQRGVPLTCSGIHNDICWHVRGIWKMCWPRPNFVKTHIYFLRPTLEEKEKSPSIERIVKLLKGVSKLRMPTLDDRLEVFMAGNKHCRQRIGLMCMGTYKFETCCGSTFWVCTIVQGCA